MKIKNQNLFKKKKSPRKSTSRPKSKQKSKQKSKKFNPLQYLNALIQLTNDTNSLKVKKNKLPQKRDLSSAMTIATPAMQKTISTSKIRCKSSYSQYRKKSTSSNLNNLKDVLNVDLNNYIITEEEDGSNCIKFTSMQSALNSNSQTPKGQHTSNKYLFKQVHSKLIRDYKTPQLKYLNSSTIDYSFYACKIQRAWRSYQTYKMIHRYYRHFKKQKRQEKRRQEENGKLRQEERKSQYAPRTHTPFNSQNARKQVQDIFTNSQVYQYLNCQNQQVPAYKSYNPRKDQSQLYTDILMNEQEQLMQKTIKFKIRNGDKFDFNRQDSHEINQKRQALKRQNSSNSQNQQESFKESLDQLNLTQKLSQIKHYIEKQSQYFASNHEEHQNCQSIENIKTNQKIEQVPTVQIKKNKTRPESHNTKNKIIKINQMHETQKSFQEEDNQSTQKKKTRNPKKNTYKFSLSINQPLDVDKKSIQSSKQIQAQKRSLVDSMIRKQTEKYNQILSLIDLCKKQEDPFNIKEKDNCQQKNFDSFGTKNSNQIAKGDFKVSTNVGRDEKSKKTSDILAQLLAKLQQHKSQLQLQGNHIDTFSSNKKENTNVEVTRNIPNSKISAQQPHLMYKRISNPINVNEKNNVNSSSKDMRIADSPHSKNSSFLAFQSRDIYKSFEEYQFSSEQKPSTHKENPDNEKDYNDIMRKTTTNNILTRYFKILHQEHHKLEEILNDVKFRQNELKEQQEDIQIDTSRQATSSSIMVSDHEEQSLNQPSNVIFHEQQTYQDPAAEFESQCNSHIENFQQEQKKQNQPSSSHSSTSIYSQCSFAHQDATNKMFRQHLSLLKIKRQLSLKNLQNLIQQNKLPKESFEERLKQVERRFISEVKKIKKHKSNYVRIMRNVNKEALSFQRDLVMVDTRSNFTGKVKKCTTNQGQQINGSSNSLLQIRKSFSAQSIVLKSILKQPLFTTKEIQVEYDPTTTYNGLKSIRQDVQPSDDESSYLSQLPKEDDVYQNEFNKEPKGNQDQMKGSPSPNLSLEVDPSNRLTNDHKQNDLLLDENNDDNNNEGQLKDEENGLDQPSQKPEIQSNSKKNRRYEQCEQVWVDKHNNSGKTNNNPSSNDLNLLPTDNINTKKQQTPLSHQQKSFSLRQEEPLLIDQQPQQKLSNYNKQLQLSHSDENSPLTTPQKQQQPSSNISQESPSLGQQQILSEQIMQRCSEELQRLIETELINQFLQTVYLNDSMLALFKPFIEEIFQFQQITDAKIMTFIQGELLQYYPPIEQLLQRANQKINPTSIQILRLVRDFDYQIQEYQLILSEDIFKKVRKSIEIEYEQKIKLKKQSPLLLSTQLKNNLEIVQKVHKRETQKRLKVQRYLTYERDMKIMYLKAVFNCLNEFLIEEKSIATHVNTRSTIGTGELSISIKEFNIHCDQQDVTKFFNQAHERIRSLLQNKCMLPQFKNYKDVGLFQKQMLKLIRNQIEQTEYKWVTYMDEVLEIWNQMANCIVDQVVIEAAYQIARVRGNTEGVSDV